MIDTDQVYRAIISDQGTTCLVLDAEHNLLHSFGDVAPYLEVSVGEFSKNVYKLLPRDLSLAVSSILDKATPKRKPAKKGSAKTRSRLAPAEPSDYALDNVSYRKGKQLLRTRLRARRVLTEAGQKAFYLLFFEGAKKGSATENRKVFDLRIAASSRISQLEEELTVAKSRLQKTIGQLETANEELQSSNEELMSSNEELQSTNEELQSVNEELHTVNAEHQRRIDELTRLTNDLNNLLKTSYVGFVLADPDLRIRRVSEAVEKMTSLRREDVGAPLETFARVLNKPSLVALAQDVLLNGRTVTEEVQMAGAPTLLLRLSPYMNEKHSIDGIVITVIEFNLGSNAPVLLEKMRRDYEDKLNAQTDGVQRENLRLQMTEQKLTNDLHLARSMLEGSTELICAVDPQLRYISFNPAYASAYQHLTGRQLKLGDSVKEAFGHDAESMRTQMQLWQQVLRSGQVTTEYVSPRDGARSRINLLALKNANGQPLGAMQTITPEPMPAAVAEGAARSESETNGRATSGRATNGRATQGGTRGRTSRE